MAGETLVEKSQTNAEKITRCLLHIAWEIQQDAKYKIVKCQSVLLTLKKKGKCSKSAYWLSRKHRRCTIIID